MVSSGGRVLALAFVMLLAGCGDPADKHPVSPWLNDNDPCIRASAEAVVKSGLPFPNYRTEPVPAAASGAPLRQRITHVDMWLGPTRFVIPAAVASRNGFYPEQHPRHYEGLSGSLPQFYPPGPPGPEIDGMGSMVQVKLVCRMDAKYVESWGKGDQTNAESVATIKGKYERETQTLTKYPGTVSVNRRDDLGMIEVLLDRNGETNEGRDWKAAYWPADSELKGFDDSVSPIECRVRHDPEERRYMTRGWRCMTGLRLAPHGHAQIDIYVSQLREMPRVFEQVKALLADARRPLGG